MSVRTIFWLEDLQNQAMEDPPMTYLSFLNQPVSPFIPGLSYLLAAYPKIGKTELLFQLAREWGAEGLKVLYFTEEYEYGWRFRLRGSPPVTNVAMVFAMGMTSKDIVQTITPEFDVVIVDTIRLLPWQDEKDNSEIMRMLTPITTKCSGKTLILSSHNKKGGGNRREAPSGGHAFVGVVDRVLDLVPGSTHTRRSLTGSGRLGEMPEIIYELQDGSMVYVGDPREVALNSVKVRVLAALNGEWMETREVRNAMAIPKASSTQLTNALNTLAEGGTIFRLPDISEGAFPGRKYKWRQTS